VCKQPARHASPLGLDCPSSRCTTPHFLSSPHLNDVARHVRDNMRDLPCRSISSLLGDAHAHVPKPNVIVIRSCFVEQRVACSVLFSPVLEVFTSFTIPCLAPICTSLPRRIKAHIYADKLTSPQHLTRFHAIHFRAWLSGVAQTPPHFSIGPTVLCVCGPRPLCPCLTCRFNLVLR
jgi:hypothetical protein